MRTVIIAALLLLARAQTPAQSLSSSNLFEDFDLMQRARMALMFANSAAGLAANIESIVTESLQDGEFGRKIRRKGLTLKREEALALTAKYYARDRQSLLQSLAELQDAVERAARPGALETDRLGYRLSKRGSAAIEKRKPVAADFKKQERPVPEDKANEGAKLKPGELEFKP